MKRCFFQATIMLILLPGCTTWTLTKRMEKKLDGNYTRMQRAILNKTWRQHTTKHLLYCHLPSVSKTILVRRTRRAEHCWRTRDELISDVLQWPPSHGVAKAGLPARTYIQQLCEDTRCNQEDLPEAMNNREGWRERVSDIMLMIRQDDDDGINITEFTNKNLLINKKMLLHKITICKFFAFNLSFKFNLRLWFRIWFCCFFPK